MKTPDVYILATGGTIDKVHNEIEETLEFPRKSQVPLMLSDCKISNFKHRVIMLKDSLDMDDADRRLIYNEILAVFEKSIVLTHGTSTMAETAEYLKDKIVNKTVVLTGAMRPFAFSRSDAPFNFGAAVVASQVLPPGVYVTMNGQVFEAGQVDKNIETGVFEGTAMAYADIIKQGAA